MSQVLIITVHSPNSAVILGPDPGDGTQTVFGPLAAGQSVQVDRGAFITGDSVTVDCWDWDDYQASLTAPPTP